MKKTLIALLTVAVLAGCTTAPKAPTLGQQLAADGGDLQKLGKQWSEGERLVTKGNKLIIGGNKDIKKGEKLLHSGKSDVKKGEAMVKKGQKLQGKAETTYNAVQPSVE